MNLKEKRNGWNQRKKLKKRFNLQNKESKKDLKKKIDNQRLNQN